MPTNLNKEYNLLRGINRKFSTNTPHGMGSIGSDIS